MTKRPLLMLKTVYYNGVADGSKPYELREAARWRWLLNVDPDHVLLMCGPRRHLRRVKRIRLAPAAAYLGRPATEEERAMFRCDPVLVIELGRADCPACLLEEEARGPPAIEELGVDPPCDAGLCFCHHREEPHECRLWAGRA